MIVKNWSFDEFPAYDAPIDGARELYATGEEIDVVYRRDIPYVTRDGLTLPMQLLLPVQPARPDRRWPLIVFVRGSAWFKQDVCGVIPLLSRFAARGYAIAMPEYRHSGIAAFPCQVQDAKSCIRFMRMHADAYSIDPEQVLLWGGSSGGHTAVLAALSADMPELDTPDYGEFSEEVKGVIDYYGVVDITMPDGFPTTLNHQQPDSPEGQFLGHVNVNEHPELAQKTVITNYVRADRAIPPVFIIHGSKDRLVNFEHSLKLYRKLRECGKDVTFVRLNGADHGGPAFWTEAVLDSVDAFARRCLRR